MIRRATENAASLDDLMRIMFDRYGGSAETFTAADVEALVSELSGVEPIPIEACLRDAGFQAEVIDGQLRVSRKRGATRLENSIIEGMFGS